MSTVKEVLQFARGLLSEIVSYVSTSEQSFNVVSCYVGEVLRTIHHTLRAVKRAAIWFVIRMFATASNYYWSLEMWPCYRQVLNVSTVAPGCYWHLPLCRCWSFRVGGRNLLWMTAVISHQWARRLNSVFTRSHVHIPDLVYPIYVVTLLLRPISVLSSLWCILLQKGLFFSGFYNQFTVY
jgi:hypothetical protein